MILRYPVLFIVFFGLSTSALAENSTGIMYDPASQRQKALFHFSHREELEGDILKSMKNIYTYAEGADKGKEAVIEDVTFENGRLKQYGVTQKQKNESAFIEIQGDRVFFHYTKDGKTESEDEKLKDNFVIGPTVVPYLRAHWETLLKGDDVDVRFGSFERKETVGFKFFKIEEKKSPAGKDVIVVKMKPTSFVIAALVSPLIFTFEKDSKRLIELNGRTVPKKWVDGKWKDLEADIVYTYQ